MNTEEKLKLMERRLIKAEQRLREIDMERTTGRKPRKERKVLTRVEIHERIDRKFSKKKAA